MAKAEDCFGGHHYYVCDVAQDSTAGAVTVIIACTACGDMQSKKFQITEKSKGI